MLEVTHLITTISRGGAENQLLTLVAEQNKCGRKIRIIYLKDKPELSKELVSAGAEVLDFIADRNPLYQIYLLRKFLKGKKVILHAHLPRAELIASLTGGPNILIATKHNTERFFPHAPKFVSRILARIVYYKFDKCVFISKAVMDYLSKIKEIQLGSKNIVVYYGIEKNIKFKLKKQNELINIGTIARVVDQKDYPTLISAFTLFHKKFPETRLIIVGEGRAKNDIVKLTQNLGVDKFITWVGKVVDVNSLLNEMDLFILSSKYEGFGLVLLEAMQNMVPIIASNNSAIPEVLGKNYLGLFDTGDKIDLYEKMVSARSIDFRKKLVLGYENRLDKFGSGKMIANIENIYKELEKNAR